MNKDRVKKIAKITKKGFTLVEIMLVVVIGAIVAVTAFNKFGKEAQTATVAKESGRFAEAVSFIQAYNLAVGTADSSGVLNRGDGTSAVTITGATTAAQLMNIMRDGIIWTDAATGVVNERSCSLGAAQMTAANFGWSDTDTLTSLRLM